MDRRVRDAAADRISQPPVRKIARTGEYGEGTSRVSCRCDAKGMELVPVIIMRETPRPADRCQERNRRRLPRGRNDVPAAAPPAPARTSCRCSRAESRRCPGRAVNENIRSGIGVRSHWTPAEAPARRVRFKKDTLQRPVSCGSRRGHGSPREPGAIFEIEPIRPPARRILQRSLAAERAASLRRQRPAARCV